MRIQSDFLILVYKNLIGSHQKEQGLKEITLEFCSHLVERNLNLKSVSFVFDKSSGLDQYFSQ